MTALSNYAEAAIGGAVLQGTAFTPPTTLYLALCTAASDTGMTEITGSGYARTAITCDNTNFTGPTGGDGTFVNGNTITLPTATGDWNGGATIPYWCLMDAATNGNMWIWSQFATPRAVVNGAVPSFAPGALTIQFDN